MRNFGSRETAFAEVSAEAARLSATSDRRINVRGFSGGAVRPLPTTIWSISPASLRQAIPTFPASSADLPR